MFKSLFSFKGSLRRSSHGKKKHVRERKKSCETVIEYMSGLERSERGHASFLSTEGKCT